jgi:hypothetical protein
MRNTVMPSLILGRLRGPLGQWSSNDSDGLMGAFEIRQQGGAALRIISSGPATTPEHHGWEHVSVSCAKRTPTWDEMCFVKNLFWEPEEMVVQLHPPQSRWINQHPYVLHLWKSPQTIELPPRGMV